MKILYLIDTSPVNGGAPISTSLIASQSGKRHKVFLAFPKQENNYTLYPNISYIEYGYFKNNIPYGILYIITFFILVIKIKKIINRISPDIIHVHMPRIGFAVGFIKMLRLLPKKISIIYTDREHIMDKKRIVKKIYGFFIAKRYSQIVTLTNINRDFWKHYFKIAYVTCIPNFAGELYEFYSNKEKLQVRMQHKILDDKINIMFSGRMNKDKNWNLASKIVDSLSDSRTRFIFSISAFGNLQNLELQTYKKALLNTNKDIIIFENLSQKEMAEIYYLADIFILTSSRESFGRTAIEAMSRKCIVLGTNVGGIPDVIGDKNNVLKSDSVSFVDRINFYINNIDQFASSKEYYYERFTSLYTMKKSDSLHQLLYNMTRGDVLE